MLLDDKYNARLADFGHASLVGEIPEALAYLQASTLRLGTVRWAAPEYFSSNSEEVFHRTIESDIYSFGSIAFQVASVLLTSNLFLLLSRFCLVNRHGQSFDATQLLCFTWPEVISLAGHNPLRSMTSIEFIEHCWSPVQGRPSAERLVMSTLFFFTILPSFAVFWHYANVIGK